MGRGNQQQQQQGGYSKPHSGDGQNYQNQPSPGYNYQNQRGNDSNQFEDYNHDIDNNQNQNYQQQNYQQQNYGAQSQGAYENPGNNFNNSQGNNYYDQSYDQHGGNYNGPTRGQGQAPPGPRGRGSRGDRGFRGSRQDRGDRGARGRGGNSYGGDAGYGNNSRFPQHLDEQAGYQQQNHYNNQNQAQNQHQHQHQSQAHYNNNDRNQGGYNDRNQGGYNDRNQGGYNDRNQGGYNDRNQGGYNNRNQGGYNDQYQNQSFEQGGTPTHHNRGARGARGGRPRGGYTPRGGSFHDLTSARNFESHYEQPQLQKFQSDGSQQYQASQRHYHDGPPQHDNLSRHQSDPSQQNNYGDYEPYPQHQRFSDNASKEQHQRGRGRGGNRGAPREQIGTEPNSIAEHNSEGRRYRDRDGPKQGDGGENVKEDKFKRHDGRKRGPRHRRALFFDGEVIYQRPEKYLWEANCFYFKTQKNESFEEYAKPEDVELGLYEKTLFKGVCRYKDGDPWSCFVDSESFPEATMRARDNNTNRSFDGSIVVFKVIAENWEKHCIEAGVKDKWAQAQAEKDGPAQEGDTKDDALAQDAPPEPQIRLSKKDKPILNVKIVFIHENSLDGREICVSIQKQSVYGQIAKFLHCQKYPHFRITPESVRTHRTKLYNSYFKAKILEWPKDEKFPLCELTSVVGDQGDADIETQCVIANTKIRAQEYPEEVTQQIIDKFGLEAPNYAIKISAEERARRLDITNLLVCTIDPETAKDLDDALSIEEVTENGKKIYKVGVHIADVSHFVEAGGFLDTEAALRSNSYYFPHKCFGMLPHILCNNLCSLNPGEEKFAFSIFFWMTEDGMIMEDKEPHLVKTIFQSCAKLSYEAAQMIIDGVITGESDWPYAKYPIYAGVRPEQICEKVLLLNKVGMKRRTWRTENGAVMFDFGDKKKYQMSLDGKTPENWVYETRKESNKLVEEWMLIANMMVGRFMVKNFEKVALLRNHAPMKIDKENMTTSAFEKVLGVKLPIGEILDCNQLVENLEAEHGLDYLTKKFLVFQMVKCLKAAEYILVEDRPPFEWHHMALNFDIYTHFTSPIRRYMDLLVHRMCSWFLEGKNPVDLIEIARANEVLNKANENKKNGRMASDKTEEIFYSILTRRCPEKLTGIVNFVCGKYIEIFCTELRGCFKVNLNSKCEDYKFEYKDSESIDERTMILTEKKSSGVDRKRTLDKRADDEAVDEDGGDGAEGSRPRVLEVKRFVRVSAQVRGSRGYPIELEGKILFD